MSDSSRAPIRFSIATPVGAYHPLLPYCLESLRLQREPVDLAFLDASGDPRVRALADAYSDVIRYRRHGPDGGQAAAIREGWSQSDADVLGWLNADDLLFPGALSKVARTFADRPDVDVVYGHSAICDERMRMTGYHWAVSPPGPALRLGCNISQPSCFFRRRPYEESGGLDGDLHYTMDWDLWLRLDEHGARFAFVAEPLSAVFWGQGTKTSGFNAARRHELKRLIDRYTPAASRATVFRGFTVQAALDRLRPAGFQRWLRQTLGRNRSRVLGVAPDGRLDPQAAIEWFHLEAEPRNILRLVVSGDLRPVRIDASRPIRESRVVAGGIDVVFAEPVPAGVVTTVTLTSGDSAIRRLRLCEWGKAAAS